jgi:uncharacterized membrane protein
MNKRAIIVGALTLVLFCGATYVLAAADDGTGPLKTCDGFADCDFQKFMDLIGKVFKWLVWISVPLATLGIGIGGLHLIFGGASEGERARGKTIIWDSIIGFVIVVAAWLIVRTILSGLGVVNPEILNLFGS